MPRRSALRAPALALAAAAWLAACRPAAAPTAVAPSPAGASTCTLPADVSPALTEGPFFKADSPERASLLEAGTAGTELVLTGFVFTPDCQPVAHALLDFWQADAAGQYDNAGYTLRGHQFTAADGRYQLTTVVPGLYPGRTEHLHVKVQAPGGPVLTTQLFFPGVANNDADGIFDARLLMSVQPAGTGLLAAFDFVVSPR
jgi:protocatechuate 3,4-dioxygenase beta subunit